MSMEVRQRLADARAEAYRVCREGWRMRIPAEKGDSDALICGALAAGEDEIEKLEAKLSAAQDAPGHGWISVKDRLPENEAKVLICMKSRDLGYRLAYLCRGTSDFWKGWPSNVEYLADEVTHWQPTPSPPDPRGE